jgi:hypothetical protein
MPCLLNKGFSTQNPDHEFSRKLQSKIALHMPQNEMSSVGQVRQNIRENHQLPV